MAAKQKLTALTSTPSSTPATPSRARCWATRGRAQGRAAAVPGARARTRRGLGRGALDDGAEPLVLKRIHEAGLFEGRVPFRRPLHPYRLRVNYRDGHALEKYDPYYFARSSPTSTCTSSARATYSIYYKLGAHPVTLDGSRARASRCGRRTPNG